MKTKLKLVVLLFVFFSLIFLEIRTTKKNDLVFDNVEALASWEDNGSPMCLFYGSIDCPDRDLKFTTFFNSMGLKCCNNEVY